MGKPTVERSFGGIVITGELAKTMDPEQVKLEKAHLKAYLRGHKFFKFGTIDEPNEFGLIETKPRIFAVKETIKTLN